MVCFLALSVWKKEVQQDKVLACIWSCLQNCLNKASLNKKYKK